MTVGITPKVSHILTFFETWAPQSTKLDYDNVGLLVGSPETGVNRILVCLDVTDAVADEAIELGCDLIVSHHPLIFKKLDRIIPETDQGSVIYKLIRNNVSLLSAHTNLDAAVGGVSFALADCLGLTKTRFLDPDEDNDSTGMGVLGMIADSDGVPSDIFMDRVCEKLGCTTLRYSGEAPIIHKVAVCGGAGVFLLEKAALSGAQAFVTADIKYHDYFHNNKNFILVDAGHFETEFPVVAVMKSKLEKAFPHIEIIITDVKTSPMQVHISTISESSNHIKTHIQN